MDLKDVLQPAIDLAEQGSATLVCACVSAYDCVYLRECVRACVSVCLCVCLYLCVPLCLALHFFLLASLPLDLTFSVPMCPHMPLRPSHAPNASYVPHALMCP